jgi:hypothetical protein
MVRVGAEDKGREDKWTVNESRQSARGEIPKNMLVKGRKQLATAWRWI